jgi:hypothetical protein
VDEGRHEGLGVETKTKPIKRTKEKTKKKNKNSFFVQPSKRQSARTARTSSNPPQKKLATNKTESSSWCPQKASQQANT